MSFIPTVQEKRVGGEGPTDCKLAIVGEAPGEEEEKKGRPFIGPSGQQLDKLLLDNGIVRRDVYVTNVIKERPDNNNIKLFIDLTKKYPIVTEAAKEYLEELRVELSNVSANCILALGNTALFALTGKTGITKWRGSILESTLLPGRKVVPTFHPRNLIGRDSVYLWRYDMAFDVSRAREESQFPELRPVPMNITIKPTMQQIRDFLGRCNKPGIVDVDIEVLRMEVSCISFCIGVEALCIPFVDGNGDYFTIEDEAEVWRLIAKVLENSAVTKRGQNFLFDISFLMQRHGIRTVNCLDTMIAQGVLYPELRKGLDYITSIYTRVPYYKDDGKKWNRITDSWDQHWTYNAKDTLATSLAHTVQMEQLARQGNIETYNRQNALIGPCSFMMQRGIKADVEGVKEAKESVARELDNLRESLYKLAGYEINMDSPSQLIDFFYTSKGRKPYLDLKTKKPSVNKLALRRLAAKGDEAAKVMLRYRKLAKLYSTYLDSTIDSDGRLRCFFNPIGTKFGRLSSSKTIFDTGMNLQNQPPEMRRFLLFDPGYIGYNMDLSQGENRVVAYIGPVPEMIEAFEMGKDVHSLTGSLLSGLPPDEVKRQDEADIKCPIGGGNYTWRYWGKRANHGLNYDLGPVNFALGNEIPYSDGALIVAKYHQAYPGIRQGYHAQIRQMLSTSRTVTNPFGRKILFLDRWGDKLFKDAYDSMAQSTIADIVDEWGLNFIYYNQQIFHDLELLLQVHDSIVFQIHSSIPWSLHAEMLLSIKKSLEQRVQWKTRSFSIPVDTQMSITNMMKGKGGGLKTIPSSAFSDTDYLAAELEKLYRSML